MKLVDLARTVRSKNAGPLKLTLDLLFEDAAAYRRALQSPALEPAAVARLYGRPEESVAVLPCPAALAIKIAATDALQAQRAIDWIRGIVAEPAVGVIYNGKVVKTAEFGAFVNFLGSRDGLVHISELRQGRVGKTTDVVNVGDQVKVKVIGFDERGKVKLSMRVVDQATGEDFTEKVGAKPGRGDRSADSGRGFLPRWTLPGNVWYQLAAVRVGHVQRLSPVGDAAPRRTIH